MDRFNLKLDQIG